MRRPTARLGIEPMRIGALALPVLLLLACGGSAVHTTGTPGPDHSFGGPWPSSTGAAPVGSEASIRVLLDSTGTESLISSRAGPFTRRVAFLAGDLTDPELERLVLAARSELAPDRLRRDIVENLARKAPGDGTLLSRHQTGAIGRAEAVAAAHPPPLSLSECARSLLVSPPARDRAELEGRLVSARQSAELFVLLDQAPIGDPLDGYLQTPRV